jgi:hypothetical protein
MKYKATSFVELLRKVAIDYVRYGYYFYVIGKIPTTKDPKVFDEQIIKTYGITLCRMARKRRRDRGEAVVAYVRYGYRFVLLATDGKHHEVERWAFKDCRLAPIQLSGYTVGVKGGKVNVQMSLKRYRALRKLLSQIALHNEKKLTEFFRRISPFKFPGILRQQQKLLKMVNAKRKKAGLQLVKTSPSPTDDLPA